MDTASTRLRLFAPGACMAPRIGVFRALHLGEMLCAVPALRALRAALPDACITLIGMPWAAGLVRRFSGLFDAHVSFPGYPGLPGQAADLAQLPGFMGAMQAQGFDCVLQMHGSGVLTNPLVRTFGATMNAGFYRPGDYCPDPLHFLPWEEDCHEVLRLTRLMEFLGVPVHDCELEFPLLPEDFRSLHACNAGPPAAPYICLHPGAQVAARRWPAERFAAVGDALHEAGLQVVLAGAAQDHAIAEQVRGSMRAPALNLAGRIGLGAFAALLARARLLLCNDTGLTHLAAAVRTPSLVMSGNGNARRWAPLDRHRHRHVQLVRTTPGGSALAGSAQVSEAALALLAATGTPFA